MILIAYDGSDDAKAAIEHAGKLFPGEQATVLNVWHRFIDTMARAGAGMGVIVDYDEIDKDSEKAAGETAAGGCDAGPGNRARTPALEPLWWRRRWPTRSWARRRHSLPASWCAAAAATRASGH